jgi:disulfide bond formation protein DsbB
MAPQERVPIGRVIPWVVLVVLLIVGLALYFQYGAKVTPLLDGTR